MRPRLKLFLPIAFLYGLFVSWYTDFGGVLSDTEVSQFLKRMEARQPAPEMLTRIERFMREDSGRQFFMVNVVDYADNPPDVAGAAAGESAKQLMDRYMAYMLPALLKRASHPTIMGDAVYRSLDLVGIENAEHWDMGAMMRYRSRRSFMEIVANADQKDSHRYKVAALDKTIAYPIETQLNLGDPRLLLGLLMLTLYALLEAFVPRKNSG